MARTIVKRCVLVKVGSQFVRTAVARAVVVAACSDGCIRVKITGQRVRTTRACGVFARTVVEVGFRIVVACRGVGATKCKATQEVARPIVDDRFRIVVAGKWVGAAGDVACDEVA